MYCNLGSGRLPALQEVLTERSRNENRCVSGAEVFKQAVKIHIQNE